MDKYLLLYKHHLSQAKRWGRSWDIFIAAYNSSERVQLIYQKVKAREKHWVILPEYQYEANEFPTGEVFAEQAENEAEFVGSFLAALGSDLENKKILVDITGFIGHYVLVLAAILHSRGVRKFDVIYGEPVRYLQSERTRFSDEAVLSVGQILGFEGVHTTDTNDDLLIMGVGYDFRLVAEVANNKEHARKIQLFGLPSLRPDMFQESLLQASRVEEAVGPDASNPQHFKYAPAHDPFVTASVLSKVVHQHRALHPRANIYLSPLSTKAHALGFAIYYLAECRGTPTSVVYPFCKTYMRETSEGLSGAWLYQLELGRLIDDPGR